MPAITKYTSLKYPFLILLLFLLVAYLPALLPFFHVKNDLITQNLPTRFFIGESLKSNTFPWWNPYINYGLPQYGDMNNGYWNPFLWIIARLFGYSILSITLEEMLYILIGGWGIYKLCKQLSITEHIALISAISYMSGGYVLGHLQHFCWITGTAFFPYVLWTFIKCIEKPILKHFILGGISGFLFVAATHPGLVIGALYFFAFIILYLLLVVKKPEQKGIYFIKAALLFAAAVLLFSPIVWVSDAEVLQHITRSSKVSLQEALMAPTTLQSYLSLLFPLAINKGSFFHTDISMRNMSIGLLALLGVIWFYKTKRFRKTWPLTLLLVFFILLASGGVFKIAAYYSLPLLGNVRLNGEFAYFPFLVLLLMGGCGLTLFYNHIEKSKWSKLLTYTLLFFLFAFLFAIAGILFTKNSVLYRIVKESGSLNSLKQLIQRLSFWDLLLISAILQFFFAFLYKKYFFNNHLLIAITAWHLILFTWLGLPFTGLSNMPRQQVQHIISSMPEGIIKPYQKSINANNYISARYDSIIGSAAFYSKQIGYPTQPYYPVVLNSTEEFYADSSIKHFINNQSYLFLASDTTANAATIYDSTKIKVIKYTPTFIKVSVINDQFNYLIFLQNNYPRWRVQVDGRPITHFTAYKTFIGILLSTGAHEVTYQFDVRSLQLILYSNIAILLLGLSLLPYKKIAAIKLIND